MNPESAIQPLAELLVGLDHIGIAVADLDAAIQQYTELFGAELEHREVNPGQKVEEAMLKLGSDVVRLQLLAATAPSSTIARFLERHGSGVQQIAYEVTDVEVAAERLRKHGAQVIYDHAVAGTDNSLVNFIHPKSAGGVLIELVQKR